MSKCKFNLGEFADRWTGERCVLCCVKSGAKVADCPKCGSFRPVDGKPYRDANLNLIK